MGAQRRTDGAPGTLPADKGNVWGFLRSESSPSLISTVPGDPISRPRPLESRWCSGLSRAVRLSCQWRLLPQGGQGWFPGVPHPSTPCPYWPGRSPVPLAAASCLMVSWGSQSPSPPPSPACGRRVQILHHCPSSASEDVLISWVAVDLYYPPPPISRDSRVLRPLRSRPGGWRLDLEGLDGYYPICPDCPLLGLGGRAGLGLPILTCCPTTLEP